MTTLDPRFRGDDRKGLDPRFRWDDRQQTSLERHLTRKCPELQQLHSCRHR
jgi:hypothetical protein